jgi:hypothetical protein
VEVKKQYKAKIKNRFAALENLDHGSDDDDDDDGIITAWESIRKNVKASATKNLCYYDLKQTKPWFGKEFPKL